MELTEQPAALILDRRQREPAWRGLLALHWPQYAALATLVVLLRWVDALPAHSRAIYAGSDAEYWRYSYPLTSDVLPLNLVPFVALGLPAAVFLGVHLAGRAGRRELHHALLMLCYAVVTAGTLASALKNLVGRPRPDFVWRCWPDSRRPVFSDLGLPLCEEGASAATVKTGMRSFPSVHAAWSSAGLGFLSLWLAGKLRIFAGGAGVGPQPAQGLLCLLPSLFAVWVGITRLQANRHHAEDVLAALMLGFSSALYSYRQAFASPLSTTAGRLLDAGAEEARVQGEAMASILAEEAALQ